MAETAVVVLFPELEPLIGELRRRHTDDGARGMPPHATLVYPFADSGRVGDLLAGIRREVSGFAPFEVRFPELARFPQTLYLRPEPREPFIAMTRALELAFPEFPPYGGQFDEIVPHVSIAHGKEALLRAIEAGLARPWPTLPVESAWLVEDTPTGWRPHTAFALNRHKLL
jgi:2'-5' RNA ligase